MQLNGTNRSTQANEAGSGGFRRRRHRRLHRGMCKGAPRPDAAGPSAVRDCPTARSRHDSPVVAAACEGMEDRREDQPVRTSGAPERACPLSLFTDLTGAFDQTLPFLLVHLGSPWNAALTFKKKSGRLPPRKKSSAHSQFQADSSY